MKIKLKYLALALGLVATFALSGCGGSSSDPVVATETYTIVAKGGTGGADGGSGGGGGEVDIYREAGGPAGIHMLKSGAAVVTLQPLNTTAYLGNNPLTVTSSMTIAAFDTEGDTPPADGVPYFCTTSPYYLYISDGDTSFRDEDPVSGLSVASGAVLTFELNTGSQANFDVFYDIENNGTITTEDDLLGDRGDLYVYCDSYHGGASSALDTSATTAGANGGYIDLNCDGNFVNEGTVDTFGADNVDGNAGYGGYFDFRAEYSSYNTGAVNTSGGTATGTSGLGGYGGYATFDTDDGPLSNSGAIVSNGGDGVDGGGYAGDIDVYICCQGTVHSMGQLTADGGNATGTGATAAGGDGGSVDSDSSSHGTWHNASISAVGGDTMSAVASAGDGGAVYWCTYYSDDSFGDEYGEYEGYAGPGDMYFSGNVDTSGGSVLTPTGATGSGGSGGSVYIYMYGDDEGGYEISANKTVKVLGYASVDISGGDGNYPGAGNSFYLYSEYYDEAVPPGPLTNEVDVVSNGGSVLAASTNPANGGYGGYFELWCDSSYSFETTAWTSTIANSGNFTANAGTSMNASSQGAEGGDVYIYSLYEVSNSGNFTLNGGDDLADDGGTAGYGGDGGGVDIISDYKSITNSGNVESNGGYGEYFGGDGDYTDMASWEVTNSGDVTSNGGDADASLTGSTGGNGGYIELWETGSNTGTLSATGGTGTTDGIVGWIRVFGQLLLAPDAIGPT